VLPVIVGLLLAAMVLVTGARATQKRVLAAIVAGAAVGVLVAGITAATNLYLTLNLALLVVQSLAVRAWLDRLLGTA
jgi:hypothetical protein